MLIDSIKALTEYETKSSPTYELGNIWMQKLTNRQLILKVGTTSITI